MPNAMTKKTIIKGGRVIDPKNGLDGEFDILLEDGKIIGLERPGVLGGIGAVENLVDASGLIVVPGLIDIHVHLREPGYEWKETIESGTHAAVCGGFSAVCCMPNTSPVCDRAQIVAFILEKARNAGFSRVYPIGAITQEQKGESLAPMLELREAGSVAFSDDGRPVSSPAVMRKALEYSLMCDAVLACHEEERSLSEGFAMNESAISLKLGLPGMPTAAEDIMIARDIELARLTGARVHFCHVSTARAVTLIERAKNDGVRVSAEVSPHHFSLTEESVANFDTAYKMSPPLRSAEDVAALLDGLSRGIIDCIASDHAPHERDSKNVEFAKASMGIIGLQTTLPLTLKKVKEGKLTLARAIEALTSAPAACLGLPGGSLKVGSDADVTIVDLDKEVVFDQSINRSKCSNSPFLNCLLRGVAVKTFVGGREVFSFEKEFKK